MIFLFTFFFLYEVPLNQSYFFIFVRLCFDTGSTLHTGLCTMILNWKCICLGFDFYVPLNRFITCNTWRESLYITFQFHLLWFCRLYWLAANLSWVYQRCQFLHFQWIYCTTVWHNYALRQKHEAFLIFACFSVCIKTFTNVYYKIIFKMYEI